MTIKDRLREWLGINFVQNQAMREISTLRAGMDAFGFQKQIDTLVLRINSLTVKPYERLALQRLLDIEKQRADEATTTERIRCLAVVANAKALPRPVRFSANEFDAACDMIAAGIKETI